jgi:peptidoglycan/LPS O-acetylase OafA/YrhL
MRSLSRPAVFGLLWLAFATAAFAASGSEHSASPFSEAALYALAGVGLILLGLVRKRRKD